MKHALNLLAVLFLLVASAHAGQAVSVEAETDSGRPEGQPEVLVFDAETLFFQLAADLDPYQAHQVRFEVREAGRVLAVQDCIVAIRADSTLPVIEIGVGNAELVGLLRNAAGEVAGDLRVDITVDGQPDGYLTAAELIELDAQLRNEVMDLQDVVSISYNDAMPATLDSFGAKTTFECPGAHPLCEDELEFCLMDCEGDYYCEKDCKKWYPTCVHGAVTYETTKTVVSQTLFALDECVWKYIWQIPFSYRADGFQVRTRVEEWEVRTCMTDGKKYRTLLSVSYDNENCWLKWGGCSFGSQVSCFLN